ncbi:MAG: hypothetical protein KF678_13975 [Phycisphaeraceae bacterium]|nr:hypothetical protein [Phycisphaeraceae bacterium]
MRAASLIVLFCSSLALAQSGGGGNPSFDQPAERPQDRARQEGRIDLRPRFEKGQSIKLKMEVVNAATQPAIAILDDPSDEPQRPSPQKKPANKPGTRPGSNPNAKPDLETTKSKVEFGIVMNVKDVTAAGEATVDMTFQTVKVLIDGPGFKQEFDSTRPPQPAKPGEPDIMSTVLRPLVGSTFTMTIDRAGNISSVTGGEGFAMLGQVTPGAGGTLPQVFGPILTQKKGDGFARVGESWENADHLNSGLMGEFKMLTRHTLQSVSGKDAKLSIRGQISPASMAPGSSTFQLKDSAYSGSYTWDTARGMIRDMATRMSITVEHSLQGQPVEVKSETTTKVTRLD